MIEANNNLTPFNKPFMTGRENSYINQVYANGQLSGNGLFTHRCQSWLKEQTGSTKVLLTHSCTAALEMAALLIDLHPGDEVIMPSYTFVSTANAFVLRGATPVFVDIREDTLNMNESLIESAITDKTRAIVAVHYAGVACEMDTLMSIAEKHGLYVIEDAAQGIMAEYQNRPLGGIGHLAAFSFHETKNIISGEGGALLINDKRFTERAEIIWEKGTNRSSFFRGEVDKYTWVDIGSSYLPGELTAAFLWGQLEFAREITDRRLNIWQDYHQAFDALESSSIIRRPVIPENCKHNAHMFYLLLNSLEERTDLISKLKSDGILSVFHYVPLHLAPAGEKFCRSHGSMEVTESLSDRLLRLPLWLGVEEHQPWICERVQHHLT